VFPSFGFARCAETHLPVEDIGGSFGRCAAAQRMLWFNSHDHEVPWAGGQRLRNKPVTVVLKNQSSVHLVRAGSCDPPISRIRTCVIGSADPVLSQNELACRTHHTLSSILMLLMSLGNASGRLPGRTVCDSMLPGIFWGQRSPPPCLVSVAFLCSRAQQVTSKLCFASVARGYSSSLLYQASVNGALATDHERYGGRR
jgi:hypothetical protein